MITEQKAIEEMTDREIAEETLTYLRAFATALEKLGSNPMLAGMMPPISVSNGG